MQWGGEGQGIGVQWGGTLFKFNFLNHTVFAFRMDRRAIHG